MGTNLDCNSFTAIIFTLTEHHIITPGLTKSSLSYNEHGFSAILHYNDTERSFLPLSVTNVTTAWGMF